VKLRILKFAKGIFKGHDKNIAVSSSITVFFTLHVPVGNKHICSYPQPQELKNKTIKQLLGLVNQSQKHFVLGTE